MSMLTTERPRRFLGLALRRLLPLVVAALAACEPYQVSDRSMNFNASLGDLDNRQVLLNAVRASKRYPPYFTAVNQITSVGELDGSQVNFSLPFGPVSHNINSVSPMVKVGTGITLQTNPLDTQDFYEGYMAPVKVDLIGYYLDYGWPQQLVIHAFMREIDLPKDIVEGIKIALYQLLQAEQYRQHPATVIVPACMSGGFMACLQNRLSDPTLIAKFVDPRVDCPGIQQLNTLLPAETPPGDITKSGIDAFTAATKQGTEIIRFVNEPGWSCRFATFQLLAAMLDEMQLSAYAPPPAQNASKPISVPTSQTGMSIKISNDSASSDTPKTSFALNKMNDPCALANGIPPSPIDPSRDTMVAHPVQLKAKGDAASAEATKAATSAPSAARGGHAPASKSDKDATAGAPAPASGSDTSAAASPPAHSAPSAAAPASNAPKIAQAPAHPAPAAHATPAKTAANAPWSTFCKDETLVTVVPRSPEALVFYLGQLIDAENPSDGGASYVPLVHGARPGSDDVSRLFDVRKGGVGAGGGAEVSVSIDGETYYIPQGKEFESTMHLLTLTEQVIGLQKKGTQTPGLVPVQVINP